MQRKGSSFFVNAPRKPQNPQMYTKGMYVPNLLYSNAVLRKMVSK